MSVTKIINLETYDQQNLIHSLKAIVDAFSGYESTRNEFTKAFPRFAERRTPNIQHMKQLAVKLDKLHYRCNTATFFGTNIAIGGGICAVAGFGILTFATGGLAAPLLAGAPALAGAGSVISALGGLTSFGARRVERFIQGAELEKINELLKADKEYFEKVFPWIQRTAALEEAIEGIMNFNVFQDMMTAFNNDPDIADAIRREQPMRELPLGVKNFIDDLNIRQEQKRRLEELLLAIFRPMEGIRLFRRILDLFEKAAPYIKKTYQILDTAIGCFRAIDASLDTGNAVVNFVKNAKPATKLAAAFGLLSAVVVAIDIVVLVKTSKDIISGSKTEIARRIRKCAAQLQYELDALGKIYAELLK